MVNIVDMKCGCDNVELYLGRVQLGDTQFKKEALLSLSPAYPLPRIRRASFVCVVRLIWQRTNDIGGYCEMFQNPRRCVEGLEPGTVLLLGRKSDQLQAYKGVAIADTTGWLHTELENVVQV